MTPLDKIQIQLEQFGAKLTPEQCIEFRTILDAFAKIYFDLGEAFKMAVIHLIPGNTIHPELQKESGWIKAFTPAKKPIGDPLQELLHNTQKLSQEQLAQITRHLSQPETVPTTTITPTKETT